jgi:uncharacterized phage protein gp47/JayE
MGFQIPTLGELVDRARRSFRAHLPGTDAWLFPNNVNPTAKVMAGMTHEVFGYADYIARQKFALTADGANLDRHGAEIGLARRPAVAARGEVTFAAPGALDVAAGAVLRRSDGALYAVNVGGALVGAGSLTLEAVASSAGKAGLAEPGTALAAVSGVSGAATIEVAAGGLGGGADVEDDEAFRARILFRKRNPPHGGAAADYVLWASEIAGVTRVFVERVFAGPGTVRVFPLMEDVYPSGGIPQPADIALIAAHVEALKPAGAALTVAAPTAVPVAITITGLTPDTTPVRDAVRAELALAFRRLSRVAGADVGHPGMPYLAAPASFSRSWIWQAVANATGEERHTVSLPAADVALTAGQIATLGTVTFA